MTEPKARSHPRELPEVSVHKLLEVIRQHSSDFQVESTHAQNNADLIGLSRLWNLFQML